MNKLDSAIVENKESTCQVSHPAIGKIYCLNAPEARATLHEICDDQLYLQAGVSISPGDVVLDIGATPHHEVVFLYSAGAPGLPFISADENRAIRTRNSHIPEFRVIC